MTSLIFRELPIFRATTFIFKPKGGIFAYMQCWPMTSIVHYDSETNIVIGEQMFVIVHSLQLSLVIVHGSVHDSSKEAAFLVRNFYGHAHWSIVVSRKAG